MAGLAVGGEVSAVIKGLLSLKHTTIGGMPFYEVRDSAGDLLAALHFRRDESIDHFLQELIGCVNYSLQLHMPAHPRRRD